MYNKLRSGVFQPSIKYFLLMSDQIFNTKYKDIVFKIIIKKV